MPNAELATSSRQAGEDMLVGLCGLATSLTTALILWVIESQFGIAIYTWTIWLVVPAGALLAGFAGASGYYAGSRFFGHRPTRLLLLNIVVASVATFLVVNYLSYVTMQIDGKQVSDHLPFWQYLDIAIRSSSMEFRFRGAIKLGSTGELGSWGYAVAALQVIGFAVGGFAIYRILVTTPYCNNCSRYLSYKGRGVRYTNDSDGLKESTNQILQHLSVGSVSPAVEQFKGFGRSTAEKDDHLRSALEVRHCKKCRRPLGQVRCRKESRQ